jgi:hypothetical protein
MLPGLLVPLAAALATGWLAWRRETRRLDARSFDEPRGWDTSETEFRRRLVETRKRHRTGVAILGALAASAAAGVILQAIGLTQGVY